MCIAAVLSWSDLRGGKQDYSLRAEQDTPHLISLTRLPREQSPEKASIS